MRHKVVVQPLIQRRKQMPSPWKPSLQGWHRKFISITSSHVSPSHTLTSRPHTRSKKNKGEDRKGWLCRGEISFSQTDKDQFKCPRPSVIRYKTVVGLVWQKLIAEPTYFMLPTVSVVARTLTHTVECFLQDTRMCAFFSIIFFPHVYSSDVCEVCCVSLQNGSSSRRLPSVRD